MTKVPLTPESDKSDAALLALSEATVEKLVVLLGVLVTALVEDTVEPELVDELEELEVALVGLKVSCPTPKPTLGA